MQMAVDTWLKIASPGVRLLVTIKQLLNITAWKQLAMSMQGLHPFQMVFFQTVHCFSEKQAVLARCVSSCKRTQGRDAPVPGHRDTLWVCSHLQATDLADMGMTTAGEEKALDTRL